MIVAKYEYLHPDVPTSLTPLLVDAFEKPLPYSNSVGLLSLSQAHSWWFGSAVKNTYPLARFQLHSGNGASRALDSANNHTYFPTSDEMAGC